MAEPFKLYRFAGTWGLPSASPFCIKLETWCRIAGLEYEAVDLQGPPKSETGKLPYIVDDGVLISDSQRIIEHLKESRGVDPDADLTPEERAQHHALRRTFEEGFYWAILYNRWVIDEHWKVTKAEYFKSFPAVVRSIVPPFLRRGVIKAVHAQGFSRLSSEMRAQIAEADLEAASTLLGDKDSIASQISSIDATVYAMIAAVLGFPLDSNLKQMVEARPNLVAYRDRIDRELWS